MLGYLAVSSGMVLLNLIIMARNHASPIPRLGMIKLHLMGRLIYTFEVPGPLAWADPDNILLTQLNIHHGFPQPNGPS